MPDWLDIRRGTAPLILSLPHTGTEIPGPIEALCRDTRLARRDCDWWIDQLYDFSADLGATIIRTRMSRTVIDVNRDPSGVSLYPGQATTELVPSTSFDGDPLWKPGHEPDAAEIAARRTLYFDPYHAALTSELAHARTQFATIVLYDCHSIRSRIPRLFAGDLPIFNIGTDDGTSCAPALQQTILSICQNSGFSTVLNGRFKGGYITRHYGQPAHGIHAVQMELACRGYLAEPIEDFADARWPVAYDAAYAAPLRAQLRHILQACITFAVS